MKHVGRFLALGTLVASLSVPSPAAAVPPDLDLVLCVDASAGFRGHIEALKLSASRFLEWILAGNASVRIGLVAYGTVGGAPQVRVVPFIENRQGILDAMLTLPTGGATVSSGPTNRAVLAALTGSDIGAWRPNASKVVIVIGRLLPGPGDLPADDVVTAARALGSVRVFGVLVAGAGRVAASAVSDLVGRTGGIVVAANSAVELPGGLMRLVSFALAAGEPLADAEGQVVEATGGDFEVEIRSPGVGPGADVLVFSRDVPALVIAVGGITAATGGRFVVETRMLYTSEPVRVGCRVRIVPG